MQHRAIACCQNPDGHRVGQNLDRPMWQRRRRAVSSGSIGQRAAVEHEPVPPVPTKYRPLRKRCCIPWVAPHLARAGFGAQRVQHRVGLFRAGPVTRRPRPGLGETNIVSPPAFAAGAMTGGQRHGLIQKEQRRPTAHRHDVAVAAPERQGAADPGTVLPADRADHTVPVQNAPIACQRAACGRGKKGAVWLDPVRFWQVSRPARRRRS